LPSEDAASGETLRTKTEKGRESWKDFQLAILWRVLGQVENLAALLRGIFAPEVCLNLCLFHFYTDLFFRKPGCRKLLGQTFLASVA